MRARLLSLLLLSAPLAAQPIPLPGPDRAAARAAGTYELPAVAAAPGGGFAVVWAVWDGGGSAVAARRFGADGRPVGGEIELADDLAGGAAPAVAMGRDGGFAVVWRTAGHTLEGRRFDHRGEALTGAFEVAAGGRPSFPAVAATAAGELVVVWQDGGVFGRRIAADGRPRGPRFRVSPEGGRAERPAVAASDDGGFVVVWQAGDGSGLGIFGRRFDRRVQALGAELRLNVHTAGDQQRPALAVGADGGFAVVWESSFQDGTPWSIFGRRFAGRGPRGSRELPVGGQGGGIQRRPALALAADGAVLVAWEDFAADPRGDVRGQWIDRDGGRLGPELAIGAGAGAQSSPALAATGPGVFAAVWTAAATERPGIGLGRFASPRLELAGGRFVAEVTWKDVTLRTGRGGAVPHLPSSGHFWFFRPEDLDLTVKIVDGRAVNGYFWVFYGALSNAAFTLRITDRGTGRVQTYLGPVGRFTSGGDVNAFPSP